MKKRSEVFNKNDEELLKILKKGPIDAELQERVQEEEEISFGQYGTSSSSKTSHEDYKENKRREIYGLKDILAKTAKEMINGFYVLDKNRLDVLTERTYNKYMKQGKTDLKDYLTQNIWANREMLAEEFDFEALVLKQFERKALDKVSLANMLSVSKTKIIGAMHSLSKAHYIQKVTGIGEFSLYEITEAGKKALRKSYRRVK